MSYKGKAIYNPSGKAGEYSYWACNFYVGCSNKCEYCYLKKGRGATILGGDVPKLKKCFKDEAHALKVFEKELSRNLLQLQEHGLFFSFTTDPMLADCSDLTWRATMIAMENDVPVKILTKVVGKWVDQIVENMHDSWKSLLAIGFTLTGRDELEPGASTNAERVEAMKKLHEAGFKTFASIEPIIDFESSLKMLQSCEMFCNLFKIGLESGKKYNKQDAIDFVLGVICIDIGAKYYFKDSLLKLAGIERSSLPENCVGRDYNLFK